MASNAENLFISLKSAADITNLVGQSEDLYKQAKRCSVPMSEDDKDHLGEALSGFANSDGGVLIYGLVAAGGDKSKGIPDKISTVQPISSPANLKSEVDSLIGQIVQPVVENVQVVVREFHMQPGSGFLVVFIPPSDLGPHRSKRDREYYRRHGSGFYKMEHFEIAEMFGRGPRPNLEPHWDLKVMFVNGGKPNRIFQIAPILGLRNTGRGIAKYPFISIRGARIYQYGIDDKGNHGLTRRHSSDPQITIFGGGANDVVYPGASLEVTALQLLSISEGDPQFQELTVELTLAAEGVPIIRPTLKLDAGNLLERYRERVSMW